VTQERQVQVSQYQISAQLCGVDGRVSTEVLNLVDVFLGYERDLPTGPGGFLAAMIALQTQVR
jgi:hypothetical protein